MKILIAEDDFVSRKVLNNLLSTLGEVDIAVNGQEAFIAVKTAIENNEPYEKYVMAAIKANCDGFLVKPIDQARLFDEIRKHGFDIPE